MEFICITWNIAATRYNIVKSGENTLNPFETPMAMLKMMWPEKKLFYSVSFLMNIVGGTSIEEKKKFPIYSNFKKKRGVQPTCDHFVMHTSTCLFF